MIPFVSELPEWEPVEPAVMLMVRAQQRVLDGLTCPVLGEQPVIVLSQPEGESVQRLAIHSCCDALDVLVKRRFAKSRELGRVERG